MPSRQTADDAEMTEQGDDMNVAPVGVATSGGSWRSEVRSLIEPVLPLLMEGKDAKEIAEALEISPHRARQTIKAIDKMTAEDVAANPSAERGRHYRLLNRIVEQRMQDKLVRDRKGEIIEKQPGVPLTEPPGNADSRTVILAMQRIASMMGIDAPTRTQNESLSVQLQIDPQAQQALMNDAEYRRLIMAAEERQRAIMHGKGHVAGAVRGIGFEGQVVLSATPVPLEPEDDGRGDGYDSPPSHLHASETRQEPVSLGLLPGVVSGHVPGSRGDIGQL